jgi:hypothetical protein
MFAPLVAFDAIDHERLNGALLAWGHKMGPLHRPRYGTFGGAYGLVHDGQLVAVVAHEKMIAASTCGLDRNDAFELARVCAIRPHLCRVALRLWREFVFPRAAQVGGYTWAISYQDRVQHRGDLYRLGHTSSGTDARGRGGKRTGRRKTVWGWSMDERAMAAAREADRREEYGAGGLAPVSPVQHSGAGQEPAA